MNSTSEEINIEQHKIQDELDQENYRQLHNVVLNFSNNSIEIKKMCITALIAVPTILFSFLTKSDINHDLVVTMCKVLMIIITLFYLIDSYTYYYQSKLRENMKSIENKIRKRNGLNPCNRKKNKILNKLNKLKCIINIKNFAININFISSNKTFIKSSFKNVLRLLKSLLNMSHLIYYILFIFIQLFVQGVLHI